MIDPVDDGIARYRVIVKPDFDAIRSGKESPWPKAEQLRPGAEVTGWVLLETVSLGFELWRQFNAFPPTVKRPPVGQKGEEKEANSKEDKEKKNGLIPIKTPK